MLNHTLFFLLLFFSSGVSAIEELSFQHPEMFSQHYEQEVQIRGFLYPLENQSLEFILAAQPNLKSCCVGSSTTFLSQIIVSGLSIDQLNPSAAQLISGILFEDSFHRYRLKEAKIIEEKKGESFYFIMGFIVVTALTIIAWRLKRRGRSAG